MYWSTFHLLSYFRKTNTCVFLFFFYCCHPRNLVSLKFQLIFDSVTDIFVRILCGFQNFGKTKSPKKYKKFPKPLGFREFLWWTIQDLNLWPSARQTNPWQGCGTFSPKKETVIFKNKLFYKQIIPPYFYILNHFHSVSGAVCSDWTPVLFEAN